MPGIPAHYPNIVRIRIREMCKRLPHYENSYYGPLDKIFNIVFSDPHFLTKPQARLRKEEETLPGAPLQQNELDAVAPDGMADEDDDEEDDDEEENDEENNEDQGGGNKDNNDEDEDENDCANTSADSYSMFVAAGSSQSGVPDFVICFSMGHIGSDVIRLVVEVKRHNMFAGTARSQLQDYLVKAESRCDADPLHDNPRLHGVLILQDNIRICQKVEGDYIVVQSWKLNGPRFYQWLESIANEDLDNPEFVHMDMSTGRWMNVLW